MDEFDKFQAERLIALHLGPRLQSGLKVVQEDYSARAREIIQQGLQDHIRDTLRFHPRVEAPIPGPYSMTIDCDDNHLQLALTNKQQENISIEIPLPELRKFVWMYWNNLKPFTRGEVLPGDMSQIFERARRNTHSLAAPLLRSLSSERGVVLGLSLSDNLFSLLTFVYQDQQKNPSLRVHLRQAGVSP